MTSRIRYGATAAIAGGLIFVAIAVVVPSRFTIVLAVLAASTALLTVTTQHSAWRSFRVTVDETGTLTVSDRRKQTTSHLADLDVIEVRRRTRTGIHVEALKSDDALTINGAGPGTSFSHDLPLALGIFRIPKADTEQLSLQLERSRSHFSGNATSPTTRTPTPGRRPVPSGEAGSTDRLGDFVWTPPTHPSAARRRTLLRVGFFGGAAALAAGIAASTIADGGSAADVAFSALTVPGMIALAGWGLDYAIGRSRSISIATRGQTMHINQRGNVVKSSDLSGADVAVTRQSALTSTGSGVHRSTYWQLTVDTSDGRQLSHVLPGFGVTTTEADYVALEFELQRRANPAGPFSADSAP